MNIPKISIIDVNTGKIVEEKKIPHKDRKDYKKYIVRYGGQYWIDSRKGLTNDILVEPGDKVLFKENKKWYSAFVSNETAGRDEDMYKLTDVEKY